MKIYKEIPDSYGVLFPFMYSYLEECIRSLTTEFRLNLLLDNERYTVGMGLINLAIEENCKNKELVDLLEEYKKYFKSSTIFDKGDNRNSVNHGDTHPILWTRENFEALVKDIARLSDFDIM
ncbi:hypothetical protein [Gemella cuniculi]|uniref:hypothetical protein n=1 Tax=Gemella cuniculi TaxID=150240 RepID=UPI000688D06F|nr:hypothetical protein [Gemella cuniculi]